MRDFSLLEGEGTTRGADIRINRDEIWQVSVPGREVDRLILTISDTPGGDPLLELHGVGEVRIYPAAIESLTEGAAYPYNIWVPLDVDAGDYELIFAGRLLIGNSIAPTGAASPGGPEPLVAIVASRAEFEGLKKADNDIAYDLKRMGAYQLVGIGGTANAITAEADKYSRLPFELSDRTELVITPRYSASGDVKLSVNGGPLEPVRDGDMDLLYTGLWVPNRLYRLRRFTSSTIGGHWRIVGGGWTLNEIFLKASKQELAEEVAALEAAWKAASNLGDSIFLADVVSAPGSGGQAVSGTIPAAHAHISVAGGQRLLVRWPETNTDRNPTLTIANKTFLIGGISGGFLRAGDLVEGVRYQMMIHTMDPPRVRLMTPVNAGDLNGLQPVLDDLSAKVAASSRFRGVIGAGQSVNEARDPGPYSVSAGALDLPEGGPSSGLLTVWEFSNSSFVIQEFRDFRTDYAPWVRTLRASENYIGAWRNGYDQLEAQLAPIVAGRAAQENLSDLRHSLVSKMRSTHLTLVGDSITWGMRASDNGPRDPSRHSLSDARDILGSSSWANKIRRWAGLVACGGRDLLETAPGESICRHAVDVAVLTDTAFKVLDPEGVEQTKYGGDSKNGPLLKSYLNIPKGAGHRCAFEFTGEGFVLVYSGLGGENFGIEVDGVEVASRARDEYSGWQRTVTVSGLAFGAHRVEVINHSATSIARLEAVRFEKTLRVTNSGLIGTNSEEWLPEGALLAGGVPDTSTHILIQLGTNDRGQAEGDTLPAGELRTSINLRRIVAWLRANRPTACITLMAPPMAGKDEQFEQEGPNSFNASADDIMREIRQVATELGAGFIDNYTCTALEYLDGAEFLGDSVHPDDHGHTVIYRNIVDAIQRAI